MIVIRLVFLAILAVLVGSGKYFFPRREKYQALLESRSANIVLVIVYQLLCYAVVALPSAHPFPFNPPAESAYIFIGVLCIGAGLTLFVMSLVERKAIGAQDVSAGIITWGIYRYFRHPIYTGIIWISLGLALTTRNMEGLMMMPGVMLVNAGQSLMEEVYDMRRRFGEPYDRYRKETGMFGPVWAWCVMGALLLAPVLLLACDNFCQGSVG